MPRNDRHISDQDLLCDLDGEQSSSRIAEIQSHLAGCWVCRARRYEIESAVQNFIKMYQLDHQGSLPSSAGPRALLKLQLAALAEGNQIQKRQAGPWLACAALLVIVAIVAIKGFQPARRPRFIPDPRLTPGATRLITRNDVCSDSLQDQYHFIPAPLAKRVFDEYGVGNPAPDAFEIDYLITPELGGSDDIRNVWPEPYADSEWNAHVKDALEEHLRQMVCSGQLDLGVAQHDIAHDWVSAYRKYFRTEHPLREHLSFTKDQPWD